jgi:hypothetical protein
MFACSSRPDAMDSLTQYSIRSCVNLDVAGRFLRTTHFDATTFNQPTRKREIPFGVDLNSERRVISCLQLDRDETRTWKLRC